MNLEKYIEDYNKGQDKYKIYSPEKCEFALETQIIIPVEVSVELKKYVEIYEFIHNPKYGFIKWAMSDDTFLQEFWEWMEKKNYKREMGYLPTNKMLAGYIQEYLTEK